ncbi:MAG: prepilin-type N-terminal cleavage/methylation domain-containing protein [Giesbergeria sp.]|nr:prepilin-type N-terminal cleavage/methylation domain-containing protein [Giesbergeria sp.]
MRQERGFTLIELLVVFAIMALVIGLAPVAFDRLRDSAQYRDTVRTMLGQMRSARYRAIEEGHETRFFVDLNRRTYGIDGTPARVLPEALQLKTTVAGIEMTGQGEAAIRFLPSGGATGGSIEVLRASGAGTRLRVDWLSGRVTQEALTP